jgi:hypothetical protein
MAGAVDLDDIPAWLEIPPSSRVAPPVETRLQELPLEQLGWEDFERLCHRLVRHEADVEHCQLYGERGQKQHGIDIFARLRGATSYATYQCRRVETFGPAAIREAIADFLHGTWSNRSSRFVLCTTFSGIRTQNADVLEEQAKLLAKRRIIFDLWDTSRISELLKAHPELVDDFFGREWVRVFCGSGAAASLGHRLDAQRVQEFRSELGRFYKHLFEMQDPGVPVTRTVGSPPFPLRERYVMPDVHLASDNPNAGEKPEITESSDEAELGGGEAAARDLREFQARRSEAFSAPEPSRPHVSRQGIETWLARSKRSIVIGGPGSGKSSLIRNLITDLFSDSPTFSKFAAMFGSLLPVFVPFAFWTKLIASGDKESSLTHGLKQWFAQWDQASLWRLVEQAIEDKRLFLLVDGLDEWTDEAAGRVACDLLRMFIEQNGLAAVVVTRRYGYERMPRFGGGWQAGELAPLSDQQRAKVCTIWFRIKHISTSSDADDTKREEFVRHDVDGFLGEVSRSSEMADLSRVPFLLLLLLYLRLERGVLPTSRFKAFELMLDHLIGQHPANRRAAASLGSSTDGLRQDELQSALAYLAFELQSTRADGLISDDDLRDTVRTFLTNDSFGLGLSASEARALLGRFTEVAEGQLGLLVRKAPKHLGFFHRSFQEYLAGFHLSQMDLSEQQTFLRQNFQDPRWRDALLTLLSMTRRPNELRTLVESMRPSTLPQALAARELRATVAFGDFNCPPDLAKGIADECFTAIEREAWMPHRERLLDACLQGLHAARTVELVRARVRRWAYARHLWRPGWLEAMSSWSADWLTRSVLTGGLYDEDPSVQRSAARTLAAVFRNDQQIGDELARQTLTSPSAMLRAAALEGLGIGWADHPQIARILEYAQKSASVEVRLAGLGIRIARGVHNDSDLQFLLELSRRRSELRVKYHWSGEIPNALIKGWSRSEILKRECLEAVRNSFVFRENALSESIALSVLLRGFPGDRDVAKLCADEISGAHRPARQFPFIGMNDRRSAWSLLAENFRDDPGITNAIDAWVEVKDNKADTMELALASQVGRTDRCKQVLIETLTQASFPHWSAWGLLAGWGMKDSEVSSALLSMATGPARIASGIGHLIPQIIGDQSAARARLLEVLRDPACVRHDFVISGLGALSEKGDEDEIVSVCFDALRKAEGIHKEAVQHDLILLFSNGKGIRALARDLLRSRNPPLSAVTFKDDDEIRAHIAELVSRLPVNLRTRILTKLASAPSDDALAQSILGDYDVEEDDESKTLASIAYHGNVRRNSGASSSIEKLLEGVSAYGPDYEERRRAAFAGLLVLERLDAMRNLQERIGGPGPVSIDLGRWNEPNLPLVRLVAEKWPYVKSVFEDALPSRISRFHHDCWSALSRVASEFPDIQPELLSILDNDPKLAIHPSCLSFVAHVKPASQLLLDRCFSAMTTVPGDFQRAPFVAAQILAENFAGDPNVHSMLLEKLPVRRNGALLLVQPQLAVALCLGWPDSELIDELYRAEDETRGTIRDHQAFFEVRLSRYPVEELAKRLRSHLAAAAVQANNYVSRSLSNAVITRVRKDKKAEEALLDTLSDKLDPTDKASIPRILGAARGLSPELSEYCLREIKEQLSRESPELGFDVLAAEVRGAYISLLDALDGPARALPLEKEVY